MSRPRVIHITMCIQCKHIDKDEERNEYVCLHPEKKERILDRVSDIPDNCPLELSDW